MSIIRSSSQTRDKDVPILSLLTHEITDMYLKIQITDENGVTLKTIEMSQDGSDVHAAHEIESLLLRECTDSFLDREPVLRGTEWLSAGRNKAGQLVCDDWEGFEWIEIAPDSDEWELTGGRRSLDELCDLINE